MRLTRRRLTIGAGVLIVAVLCFLALRSSPVLVDVARIERGSLRMTVDDDGQTRVRERYTISAPFQGRLLRVSLDPGDDVRANRTVVAEFSPRDPDLLDARTRAEASARVARAEAALGEARARRQQAQADLRFAEDELQRTRRLFEKNIQSKDVLDQRDRDAQRARQALRAADFAIQVASFEVEMARASLSGEERSGDGARGNDVTDPATRQAEGVPGVADGATGSRGQVQLRSPIDGKVLRVFEQSARTLAPGTPILEVGNTRALEVVADYLSQDAVLVEPGMAVEVLGFSAAGRDSEARVLTGQVRRVEPAGFTKVSSLGVEEQRVNIVVDPVGDLADWGALGDGFRVELRIVLWQADDVIRVPMGALFRIDQDWAAFVVEAGVARQRTLEIDHRSGLAAEVISGLEPGEVVVLYPNDLIQDGTRVEVHGGL